MSTIGYPKCVCLQSIFAAVLKATCKLERSEQVHEFAYQTPEIYPFWSAFSSRTGEQHLRADSLTLSCGERSCRIVWEAILSQLRHRSVKREGNPTRGRNVERVPTPPIQSCGTKPPRTSCKAFVGMNLPTFLQTRRCGTASTTRLKNSFVFWWAACLTCSRTTA